MIGRCLGRPHAWVVRAPGAAVWTLSAFNELVSQIRGRPHILNLDKAREATAGSWACSPALLQQDTGFRCGLPLEERIDQTVDWYVSQGWLQRKQRHPPASLIRALLDGSARVTRGPAKVPPERVIFPWLDDRSGESFDQCRVQAFANAELLAAVSSIRRRSVRRVPRSDIPGIGDGGHIHGEHRAIIISVPETASSVRT